MQAFFPFSIYNGMQVLTKSFPLPQNGKGIFTTIKIVDMVPFFLERHLLRLGMESQKDFFQKHIKSMLQKNKITTAAMRISIYDNGEVFFHARDLPKDGLISAVTIVNSEKLPVIKKIDRYIYKKAKEKARDMHADEAIFVENNHLIETTIANIIYEDGKGNLITPKLANQGLKGIARKLLLGKGYVIEKDIPIITKGPLIAVNSLRIMGIQKLNTHTLVNPLPLMQKVREIVRKEEENYENSYYR